MDLIDRIDEVRRKRSHTGFIKFEIEVKGVDEHDWTEESRKFVDEVEKKFKSYNARGKVVGVD